MADLFEALRPHRRLIAYLETAGDALQEALVLNATLGVLPHWAEGEMREIAETLEVLLGRLEREGPHLAPLSDAEWGQEEVVEDG